MKIAEVPHGDLARKLSLDRGYMLYQPGFGHLLRFLLLTYYGRTP